jgi:hypothetical protein
MLKYAEGEAGREKRKPMKTMKMTMNEDKGEKFSG